MTSRLAQIREAIGDTRGYTQYERLYVIERLRSNKTGTIASSLSAFGLLDRLAPKTSCCSTWPTSSTNACC